MAERRHKQNSTYNQSTIVEAIICW